MLLRFALLILLALSAQAEPAVTGQVLKVLPLYLDLSGRSGTSPSLFERDAYQAQLLKHPDQRSGLEFAVNWKASGPKSTPLLLRLELRGGRPGQLPTRTKLEQALTPKGGLFGTWTSLKLVGEDYKSLGEMNSWRATLWQGETMLGEQKSFLWNNEPRTAITVTNPPPKPIPAPAPPAR